MTIRDEIKTRQKVLKENGTTKQKITYFFDYYTIHTIVIVAILAIAIWLIHDFVTRPDTVFSGIVLNASYYDESNPVEDMGDGFMEYIDMDTKEYEFALNSALSIVMGDSAEQLEYNYAAAQAIMAQCTAGTIDFISSPLSTILNYGYGNLVVNLEEVLTEEDFTRYEPYFLYADRAVIQKRYEAFDNNEDANEIPLPDPSKPEEMEDPMPVFIDVTKCEKMANIYDYSEDTIVVAIAANAPNPDRISDFLAYIFEE